MKNLKTFTFIAIAFVVIGSGCKKDTKPAPEQEKETWHISKGNLVEKPLPIGTDTTQQKMTPTQVLTTYGCGSNLSGSYGGSGYYSYPSYSLNFNTSPQNTRVNVTVGSYDIPNRFTIYDSLGRVVAYTSWMGYVTYAGPWGMSLNTPETQVLTFTTDVKGPYLLKVETSTQGYSDSWTATVGCVLDTSYKNAANPNDKAGALHNSLLDYFNANATLPLSNGNKIIYTFDKDFKIYGSDSVASKSVLPAPQVSFAHQFENSADHFVFLVQGHYMSQAGVNYYKKLDSLIDANSVMSALYASIKSIESQVMASSLPQNEKNTLLEAASVERYSAYYWSIPSNLSKWNVTVSIPKRNNNTNFPESVEKFSWGGLGKADLKGAIEGGVAGAVVGGTVATPVGSVPGWVAGAVSWGAGCSVSNAIGQLTGWW